MLAKIENTLAGQHCVQGSNKYYSGRYHIMERNKEARDSSNSKKIKEMVQKYGALFYGSTRLLTGMENTHDEVDEKAIGKLLDSTEFLRLLDRIKQATSKENSAATRGQRIKHSYADMISDIVASIYVSDDMETAYAVGGSSKNLFELDIGVANALVEDPKRARKAVSLINRIAINSLAISEIIKNKNGFFPEEAILSGLTVEFYKKLMENIGRGADSYKNFISSCFNIVEGGNIGYNVALLSKSDIINGLEDEKLALNRLLGLHYFISGVERR